MNVNTTDCLPFFFISRVFCIVFRLKRTGSSSFTLPTKYRKKNCNQIVNQIILLSGLFKVIQIFFFKVSAFFVNINAIFVLICGLLLVKVSVQNLKMKDQI